MKYLESFNFKRYVGIPEIIKKYGEDNAAIFLNIIFKDKYVKVINGIPTPRIEKDIDDGIIERIFYISTSGFMILRFKNGNDIIINNADLQAYANLDYELGELAIKSKKYNL